MAGELEYWAAQVRLHMGHPSDACRCLPITWQLPKLQSPHLQGRAPLPYALSELVDNALRATQSNAGGRHITITLVTSGGASPGAGLISVWDNGARCWCHQHADQFRRQHHGRMHVRQIMVACSPGLPGSM
jgi:hypothetical protein